MYKQLTSGQRYTIFALLQKGFSKKEIASTIGGKKKTVAEINEEAKAFISEKHSDSSLL